MCYIEFTKSFKFDFTTVYMYIISPKCACITKLISKMNSLTSN